MAVYVLISATSLPDKWHEAPVAAQKSIAYLASNSAYRGSYEILRPANGPNSRYYWLCRYASYADYEHDNTLRANDAGWAEVWKDIDASTDVPNITSQTLNVL